METPLFFRYYGYVETAHITLATQPDCTDMQFLTYMLVVNTATASAGCHHLPASGNPPKRALLRLSIELQWRTKGGT
ncbi:hypothetical protein K7X08_037751 [Anisodus acutangulus]|uniref:Uncharacterized protein n=1 Tax=Anisodus acutangulus TaxID=402998 RepID=A0A9Q1RSI0_9SOLA|nr:hypothetical protein K7X08_037751 [Anisodus acutangulus]